MHLDTTRQCTDGVSFQCAYSDYGPTRMGTGVGYNACVRVDLSALIKYTGCDGVEVW
jgi:hypothetical protein